MQARADPRVFPANGGSCRAISSTYNNNNQVPSNKGNNGNIVDLNGMVPSYLPNYHDNCGVQYQHQNGEMANCYHPREPRSDGSVSSTDGSSCSEEVPSAEEVLSWSQSFHQLMDSRVGDKSFSNFLLEEFGRDSDHNQAYRFLRAFLGFKNIFKQSPLQGLQSAINILKTLAKKKEKKWAQRVLGQDAYDELMAFVPIHEKRTQAELERRMYMLPKPLLTGISDGEKMRRQETFESKVELLKQELKEKEAAEFPVNLFDTALDIVQVFLENSAFPNYIKSDQYLNLCNESSQRVQSPRKRFVEQPPQDEVLSMNSLQLHDDNLDEEPSRVRKIHVGGGSSSSTKPAAEHDVMIEWALKNGQAANDNFKSAKTVVHRFPPSVLQPLPENNAALFDPRVNRGAHPAGPRTGPSLLHNPSCGINDVNGNNTFQGYRYNKMIKPHPQDPPPHPYHVSYNSYLPPSKKESEASFSSSAASTEVSADLSNFSHPKGRITRKERHRDDGVMKRSLSANRTVTKLDPILNFSKPLVPPKAQAMAAAPRQSSSRPPRDHHGPPVQFNQSSNAAMLATNHPADFFRILDAKLLEVKARRDREIMQEESLKEIANQVPMEQYETLRFATVPDEGEALSILDDHVKSLAAWGESPDNMSPGMRPVPKRNHGLHSLHQTGLIHTNGLVKPGPRSLGGRSERESVRTVSSGRNGAVPKVQQMAAASASRTSSSRAHRDYHGPPLQVNHGIHPSMVPDHGAPRYPQLCHPHPPQCCCHNRYPVECHDVHHDLVPHHGNKKGGGYGGPPGSYR